MSHLRFRDLYAAVARLHGQSDEDIHLQILAPTDPVVQPLTDEELDGDVWASLFRRYATTDPDSCYELGLKRPFKDVGDPRGGLRVTGPTTVVLIPGVFSEFIERRPFEEVMNRRDSTFAKEWQPAIDAIQGEVYSIRELDTIRPSMGELVKLASIDDEDGTPLVQVISLVAMRGSLETCGLATDNVQVYLKRLKAVFEVLGPDVVPDVHSTLR